MEDLFLPNERQILLGLARNAIQDSLSGKKDQSFDLKALPPRLQKPGATFVTITKDGELRGCIGTLNAYQPLAVDVCEHAVAAATQDHRFSPLQLDELPLVKIEVSVITSPKDLDYDAPQDLPSHIRPHIDGVTLMDGFRRATFLPQVWEKLPDPEIFLNHLCQKMGASPDTWRVRRLSVQTYQVEEFHE
jgi:AmmeMemoRadiSam system protein A